jgi:hypothetical protein
MDSEVMKSFCKRLPDIEVAKRVIILANNALIAFLIKWFN